MPQNCDNITICLYILHESCLLYVLDKVFVYLNKGVIKLVALEQARDDLIDVVAIRLFDSAEYIIFLAIHMGRLTHV